METVKYGKATEVRCLPPTVNTIPPLQNKKYTLHCDVTFFTSTEQNGHLTYPRMLRKGSIDVITGSSRYSKLPGCRSSFWVKVTSSGSDVLIRSRLSSAKASVRQTIEE